MARDWSGCWWKPLKVLWTPLWGGHGHHGSDRATRWQNVRGHQGQALVLFNHGWRGSLWDPQRISSFNSYNDNPVIFYSTDGKVKLKGTMHIIWGHTTVKGWQLTIACKEPDPVPDTWNLIGSIFHSVWKEPSSTAVRRFPRYLSRSPIPVIYSYWQKFIFRGK